MPPGEALAAVCLGIHDFDGAGRPDGDPALSDVAVFATCFTRSGSQVPAIPSPGGFFPRRRTVLSRQSKGFHAE